MENKGLQKMMALFEYTNEGFKCQYLNLNILACFSDLIQLCAILNKNDLGFNNFSLYNLQENYISGDIFTLQVQ